MIKNYRANYMPLTLRCEINTSSPVRVRLIVKDTVKPNTYFCNRFKTVFGHETIDVRMPQTSKEISIITLNERTKDDKGINIKYYPLDLIPKLESFSYSNRNIQEFIEFAQNFSMVAGYYSESIFVGGSKGQFVIRYEDNLFNNKSQVVNTPARVGSDTGTMDISRIKYRAYSIPMRMIILLHEFSHFWLNDNKHDEEEADYHALNIYLGLGYPKHEALVAFATVFLGADNEQNRKRYDEIEKFVTNFDHSVYAIKYK